MAFDDLLLASGLDLETLQVKLLRLLHHQATDYTTTILFDGVTVLILQMVAEPGPVLGVGAGEGWHFESGRPHQDSQGPYTTLIASRARGLERGEGSKKLEVLQNYAVTIQEFRYWCWVCRIELTHMHTRIRIHTHTHT